jgi:hypothetical protein
LPVLLLAAERGIVVATQLQLDREDGSALPVKGFAGVIDLSSIPMIPIA